MCSSDLKPATKEIYPARTFDQLVGDGSGRALDKTILDSVLEDSHSLQPKISRNDKVKLAVVSLRSDAFRSAVNVTDADVSAHYEAMLRAFSSTSALLCRRGIL